MDDAYLAELAILHVLLFGGLTVQDLGVRVRAWTLGELVLEGEMLRLALGRLESARMVSLDGVGEGSEARRVALTPEGTRRASQQRRICGPLFRSHLPL